MRPLDEVYELDWEICEASIPISSETELTLGNIYVVNEPYLALDKSEIKDANNLEKTIRGETEQQFVRKYSPQLAIYCGAFKGNQFALFQEWSIEDEDELSVGEYGEWYEFETSVHPSSPEVLLRIERDPKLIHKVLPAHQDLVSTVFWAVRNAELLFLTEKYSNRS